MGAGASVSPLLSYLPALTGSDSCRQPDVGGSGPPHTTEGLFLCGGDSAYSHCSGSWGFGGTGWCFPSLSSGDAVVTGTWLPVSVVFNHVLP